MPPLDEYLRMAGLPFKQTGQEGITMARLAGKQAGAGV
jgi:hypothetical protein